MQSWPNGCMKAIIVGVPLPEEVHDALLVLAELLGSSSSSSSSSSCC